MSKDKKTTAKKTAKAPVKKAAAKKVVKVAVKKVEKAPVKKAATPVAARPWPDPRLHPIPLRVEYNEKHTNDFRGDVKEHGFHFAGYDWDDKEAQLRISLHYDQLYAWKLAELSKMGRGFLDAELWGTQCPKCGDKFFPPRVNCWRVDEELVRTNWVRLKPEGYVHTFTIAGWSGKSSLKRLPFVLAYVVLDGCKTAVANELRGLDPWDTEFNMPVKVVWSDKKDRRGAITDFHFEPADGWKPSVGMTPEKERMKKLCEPVYEWVKSLK